MLERAKERFGLQPVSITADKSYGTEQRAGSSDGLKRPALEAQRRVKPEVLACPIRPTEFFNSIVDLCNHALIGFDDRH